jgi:hypothetical protein
MKYKISQASPFSIALVALCFVAFYGTRETTLAQTGDGYDLSWWTVDGGGGAASGGGYTLVGTAGQPEPGAASTGGGYALIGGFWFGAGVAAGPGGQYVYLPLVLTNYSH